MAKGGQIVETQHGKIGKTKNSDKLINGKVIVHLEGGTQMLCLPHTLKIIGYWD